MKFITLEPEEFRKFAEKSPYKSFMQTPELASYREKNGWVPYYFGVERNNKLVAATMLIAKPTFLGKSTYYAPGGPIIDFEDEELLDFFIKNLKRYAKSHNGYILHIDPYYELIERDRYGEIKEGGFSHQQALKNLRKLGFIEIKNPGQPKYLFALDFKKHTADQIFADMKRNTRNHIRKAEKMGVKVRELNREELGIFKKITESTSNRRNFTDRPLSYYQQMYDLFHPRGEVKFLIAEVQPKENASDNKLENNTIEGIPEPGKARVSAFSPVATGENDATRNGIISSSQTIPLSAAMFILYGNEVIYLFSGSDEKYMKEYNAQYLIQWHMIKYALEHKFKTYNFYGIQGLPDKSSKDYGIYDFKKGFTSDETGRVIELIGSYELPINIPFYHLHQLLSKLKNH